MIRRTAVALILCGLFTVRAFAQTVPPFDASGLVNLGDSVKYGSYIIYKIGEGIYKINDPGDKTTRLGGLGVDMYLIRGANKAFMVDLGNNYIDGFAFDLIKPRKNAAEELRAVEHGLAGDLPLEIGITHAHPDHAGMTGAFVNQKNVTFWMGEHEGEMPPGMQISFGKNLPAMPHNPIDLSVYKRMASGKQFDLGDGRVLTGILLRGHTQGSTVYLLTPDMYLFTGDALGSGFGQGYSTVPVLKEFAEDSQKLADYITEHFKPYERYSLKVYTGHTWQNTADGFLHPNHDQVDVGYLDWRFIQNEASCANGILKGKWLVEGSGLINVGKQPSSAGWPGANQEVIMTYGIGTIIIPLQTAYDAAGLKMPSQ
jgi:glyoxylase-like metal-dependent hydrolase (beta-lactamase superfamily II)